MSSEEIEGGYKSKEEEREAEGFVAPETGEKKPEVETEKVSFESIITSIKEKAVDALKKQREINSMSDSERAKMSEKSAEIRRTLDGCYKQIHDWLNNTLKTEAYSYIGPATGSPIPEIEGTEPKEGDYVIGWNNLPNGKTRYYIPAERIDEIPGAIKELIEHYKARHEKKSEKGSYADYGQYSMRDLSSDVVIKACRKEIPGF